MITMKKMTKKQIKNAQNLLDKLTNFKQRPIYKVIDPGLTYLLPYENECISHLELLEYIHLCEMSPKNLEDSPCIKEKNITCAIIK